MVLSGRQDFAQPQQRDALDLLAGGVEFGGAVVADARLEGGEDVVLGLAPHRDDEGEAELRDIGGVELGERVALGVGQRVEPGGGLLVRSIPAVRRLAAASLPARSGWAFSTPSRSSSVAARNTRHSALCRPPARVVGGAELQLEGAFGDPGRMLEDAAEQRDEIVSRSMLRRPDAPAPVGMALAASAGRCRCAAASQTLSWLWT